MRLSILFFILVGSFCMTASKTAAQPVADAGFVKVRDGLQFPEGPAWNGRDKLYASNCHGDWITVIAPDTTTIFLRAGNDPFTFSKTNGSLGRGILQEVNINTNKRPTKSFFITGFLLQADYLLYGHFRSCLV